MEYKTHERKEEKEKKNEPEQQSKSPVGQEKGLFVVSSSISLSLLGGLFFDNTQTLSLNSYKFFFLE